MNSLHSKTKSLLGCFAALLCSTSIVMAEPIKLAMQGSSDYRIVIRQNPTKVDTMAAEELSTFIEQASGVKLPVVTDAATPTAAEIVLGNTNRLGLKALPAALQPRTNDGFVIYPQNKKLFILGNVRRSALYGVYDFLEQEVGVRFLSPDLTHVPKSATLRIDVQSRKFDPDFEHRSLHLANPQWSLRQRLNGSDGIKSIDVHLGGTAFIRPKFVHTFGLLMPPEKYFAKHPEYYALHKGKRVPADYNGVGGQLCLTNVDVQEIVSKTAKEWLEDHAKDKRFYDEDEQTLVSISINDNSIVCECPNCQKVNEEEGSNQGTLIRMVNHVAQEVEKEYPNARIETLGGYSEGSNLPKTRPRHNVLIRFATGSEDMMRPITDEKNRQAAAQLKAWAKLSPVIYTWNYHTVIANHFKPFPDLKYLGEHVRFQREHNVKGYFSESTRSRRAAFQDLRNYVLSRTLWRPELDTRKLVEEYCNLSYGPAAKHILQYVDMIDEYARAQNKSLYWTDGTNVDRIVYEYPFLLEMNALLQVAEDAAPDAVTKDRIVREHRLGLWYLILERGLSGEAGGTITLPIEWRFKKDPQEAGTRETWYEKPDFDDWEKIRVDRFWTAQGHNYHGTAWYGLNFEIKTEQAGRIKALSFGAVDGTHDLYLDGELVHQRHDEPGKTWNIPFTVTLKAPLPAGKHTLAMRVSKDRMAAGIWQPVRMRDPQAGLPEEVQAAAKRFLEVAPTDPILLQMKGWEAPRQEEIGEFVKRVNWMLRQNENPGRGTVQPAAMLPNTHKTYSAIDDPATQTGQAVVQNADRDWTLGQSVSWYITEHLKQAVKNGEKLQLKVRVRLDRKNGTGAAFRFGYATYNRDWSGQAVDEMAVTAQAVSGDEWQWFTLPNPVKYVESERGTVAYVRSENNPEGVGKVYVDAFVLERQ